MYLNAAARKAATAAKFTALLGLFCALTFFSSSCKDGVSKGIEVCLSVLVPSIFPFMALSRIAVKTGACSMLGRRLTGVTRLLFGLSGAFAPAMILSMLGGYPIGAKSIVQLVERGEVSEHEAKKAMLFAVCSGPGFAVNYVGNTLYKSNTVGMILLCAQIASVILLGMAINFFDKDRKKYYSDKEIKTTPEPFGNALVEASLDASKGMINICSLVLIFSALSEIYGQLISSELVKNTLDVLLEVCSAVSSLSQSCPIELVAFAIGFGGLCVHFQIFSAAGKVKLNKALFFLVRMIQGLLTMGLTKLGTMIFLKEASVFSTGEAYNPSFYKGSIVSAAALLIAAICFLFSFRNNEIPRASKLKR